MSRSGRHVVTSIVVLLSLAAAPDSAGGARAADNSAPSDATAGSVVAAAPITDDALVAEIDAAATDATRVRVEVLTDDVAAASAAVGRLGGTVTGSVPGQLVQAWVPSGAVDDLGRSGAGITWLQAPRRVNHLPAAQVELGTSTGEQVTVTNAAAWQAAGIRGAVKVGIVDFFDLGLWNPVEHGAAPSLANGHLFCRDTSATTPSYCPMAMDGVNNGDGQEHGVAVAEVVKDMAPDADLFLATVATTSDLRAAMDWFVTNGVSIVTRSLGAPFDGPGDGTGPIDAVVDYAADRGITWFNSAGNDAAGGYGRFTGGVTPDGYVDFDNGPGVDTDLALLGSCIGVDGIRWANDWGKPAPDVTDYAVEVSTSFNPVDTVGSVGNQAAGAPPLELVDAYACGLGNVVIRIRRELTGDLTPDVIEVALFQGRLETGRSSVPYSAAKPVVDSKNPSLLAVGAVDPPTGGIIANYSSQGPTNDGRLKPDISAPSCLSSTIYRPAIYGSGACFNGTSAASPVAAGVAALLLGRGLANPGATLAALVRHLVVDRGIPGPDVAFGYGEVALPAPPTAALDGRPATFTPLAVPQRILDTRPGSASPGVPLGPFAPSSIIDLPVPAVAGAAPITAVAVSIVSVDSTVANYVQALPALNGRIGAYANLNVASPGQIKPNFAIVPTGSGGSISLFLPTGGNVIVDMMGWFSPAAGASGGAGPTAVAAGRFVALTPERVLDTRSSGVRPVAGQTISIATPASVPADAAALVVNVTATDATGPGFLRLQPTGAGGLTTANGNYVVGVDSGTMGIVPFGNDHTVSVYTSNAAHVVADITGYITGASSPVGTAGLFVPVSPGRAYDSRTPPNAVHDIASTRTISIAGPIGVPAGASAVSMNLAADAAVAAGFLTASPAGEPRPVVSNLNFPIGTPISNAGMVRLSTGGALDVFVNQTTHVIIDVNGYFTGTT